jgi:hypothetical protein
LAAILRLANAFDTSRDRWIQRLEVKSEAGFLIVAAQGYSARNRAAEAVAAGRHLLETVYRCPVIVRPMRMRAGKVKAGGRPKAFDRKGRKGFAKDAKKAPASS